MRMWVWIPRFHTKADKTQPCASVVPMARWRQRQENVWKAQGPTSPAYVVTHKTASNKMEDEDWRLRLSCDSYICVMASDCPAPLIHTYIIHTYTYIHKCLLKINILYLQLKGNYLSFWYWKMPWHSVWTNATHKWGVFFLIRRAVFKSLPYFKIRMTAMEFAWWKKKQKSCGCFLMD